MAVTGQLIEEALGAVGAKGKQIRSYDELARGADGALRQAPGLTPAGAAGFLASMVQESAYLRTTVEYGKNLHYDPWRGRTFEMLTWEGEYGGFGEYCHRLGLIGEPGQFRRDPRSMEDYRFAWLGGTYYFQKNALWNLANPGNFFGLSQAINGGRGRVGTKFVPNGWDHRKRMYDVFLRFGPALLPGGPPQGQPAPASPANFGLEYGMRGNPVLARLQKFCNDFPWRPALPVFRECTGNYLDQTVVVIRGAALQMGVQGADGRNVGPQLTAGFTRLGFRG